MLHTPPHISHKQYAVLHFAKPKGNKALRKLGQHIDRQQISPNVNARRTRYNQTYLDQDNQAPLAPLLDGTIDPTQKEQNHDYIDSHTSLPQAIAQRIQEGYTVKNKMAP